MTTEEDMRASMAPVEDTRPHFYKAVYRAQIRAVDGVDREEGLRFYCEQVNASWIVQVRAPLTLRNGREGKDFMVASAYVDLETLRAFRDAIDRHLKSVDGDD